MKDKIAGIIKSSSGNQWRTMIVPFMLADEILSLFKNIQVEVECPECGGKVTNLCAKGKCDNYYYDIGQGCASETGNDCPVENGCPICKGETFRPATPEEMEKGGMLKRE